MRKITAEGTEFILLDAQSDLNGITIPRLPFPIEQIASSTDSRIALFDSYRPNNPRPYVLVWQDGTNLEELESRIQKGSYKDSDFANAFRTSYHKLRCRDCGKEVGAFVIEHTDLYPLSNSLHREKEKKLKRKYCPDCNSSLTSLVVKIIDKNMETFS